MATERHARSSAGDHSMTAFGTSRQAPEGGYRIIPTVASARLAQRITQLYRSGRTPNRRRPLHLHNRSRLLLRELRPCSASGRVSTHSGRSGAPNAPCGPGVHVRSPDAPTLHSAVTVRTL